MKALIPFVIVAACTIGCGSDSDDSSATDTSGTTATDATDASDGSTADVVDTADTGTTDGDEGTPPADEGNVQPDGIIGPPPTEDTKTEEDAGKTDPPTTCRQAVECWSNCKNADCRDACIAGAEQSILDSMATVQTCVEGEGGCIQAPIQCLVEECFGVYSDCAFAGKSGDDKCSDLNECILGCSDEACEDGCFQTATVEAQKNYVKLQVCVKNYADQNCDGNLDETCKKQAEQSAFCSTQYDFCLGDKS